MTQPMTHPLYSHAMRCVGRGVHIHHANGRIYHGILHLVTRNGIYVLHCRPVGAFASFEKAQNAESIDVELVYSPGAYFAFGALTGLTIGVLGTAFLW